MIRSLGFNEEDEQEDFGSGGFGPPGPLGPPAGSPRPMASQSFVSNSTSTTLDPRMSRGHVRSNSGGSHVVNNAMRPKEHRRSHSSCGYQPVQQPGILASSSSGAPGHPGILATQQGHQRRASAGQQVTFRGLAEDPQDLTGIKVTIEASNKV